MTAGIIIFIIGLILFTIGGMISFVRQYGLHNRNIRMKFDLKRPPAHEFVTMKELFNAYFNDPKAKIWCRVGFGLGAIGIFLTWLE